MNPEPNTSSLDLIEERREPYLQGNYRRTYTDFRSLEHALLSGDLTVAREAFASLKEDIPALTETLSREPFPDDNSRVRAFKEMGRCLLKGDLQGANQAYRQFQ